MIMDHHIQQNAMKGRPIELSRTISMCREAMTWSLWKEVRNWKWPG